MPQANAQHLGQLFKRIRVRDDLPPDEEQALIEAAGEIRHFPLDATIVAAGDRPQSSTLLISGLTSRYNITKDGGRQITAVHVPGDFVDLHSFPLKKMDHSIGALTSCDVVTFPHENLRELTRTVPHLSRILWMLTLIDGAMHRRWLVAMGRTSALSHLAHFICEMYLRLESVGLAADHTMILPLTQMEMADVLGISAVHTNRVLQDLRSQDLVAWQGTEVRLRNFERLKALAEFDPDYLFIDRIPQ